MVGPLDGLRVVELAGIGPAPFAGMVLADLGADVVRVDRPGPPPVPGDPRHDLLGRGKRSIVADLKTDTGVVLVRRLAAVAQVFIEGFRPGVAERLGIGPAECHALNPTLVYGRVTGWGRRGPLAGTAGHDLTYLATSGVLQGIGPPDGPPVPPLNIVGDYGGAGMLLAVGVLSALWRGGTAEVVDASIVDGSALLLTQLYGFLHSGLWRDAPGANLLDGGAPNYRTYRTADGRWLAVAPLEPRFFAEFAARLGGLDGADPYDPGGWPSLAGRIAERIATRTLAEWVAVFEGSDACVAPVLSLREAAEHPQTRFIDAGGIRQPAPAPRFARAALDPPARLPPLPGEHDEEIRRTWLAPR
jgi:alpha-methylacyl-CoA racemase